MSYIDTLYITSSPKYRNYVKDSYTKCFKVNIYDILSSSLTIGYLVLTNEHIRYNFISRLYIISVFYKI